MPTTEEPATHTTGTIEWFDPQRGVGLISSDDGAPPCSVRSGGWDRDIAGRMEVRLHRRRPSRGQQRS